MVAGVRESGSILSLDPSSTVTGYAAIAQLYPSYSEADDAGGDVADALGLARYWLLERIVR